MFDFMEDCDSFDKVGNQCYGLHDIFKDEMSELGESSSDWWRDEADKNSQSSLSNRDGGSQSPVFKTPQLSLKNRRCRKTNICSHSTSGLKRYRESSPAESLEWYSPFKSSRLSPIVPTTEENEKHPESLQGLVQDGSEILWSSAFATPTASNATRSKLISEEKKLLLSKPLTSESGTVPASLEVLLQDGSETSWNSAFATPITSKGTCSRLNSEERQVLLPTPMTGDTGTVPGSLEPLLQDGSAISWNSAFATPVVSNETSKLNSEERKLLIPTSTSKNLWVLFTSESESEERNFNFSSNMNGDSSLKESTILFEKTVTNKTDSESSGNSILFYSTPSHSRTYIISGSRNLSKNLTVLENDAIKSEEEIVKLDIEESNLVRNDYSSNSENRDRLCSTKPRRKSTLTSPDSGMNDFTTNSVETDLRMSSVLTSAGSMVPRKLFNGEGQDTVAPAVPLEDSGAGGSRETSNAKLSASLNLSVSFQSSPSPIIHKSSEMKLSPAQDLVINEDFAHNLSFNTLEEVCQVTELMAESIDSQIECAKDVKTPYMTKISIPNVCLMSRTSTPITRTDKYNKFEIEIKKKRLKFVQLPNNGMPIIHNQDNRTNKSEMVENGPVKFVCEPESNNVSDMENLSSVTKSNIMESSRFQAIKSVVNRHRKFAYVPSTINHNIVVSKKEDNKILLEDIVESANTLESVAQRRINKDKERKLVQFLDSSKQKTGFMPFCEFQSHACPKDYKDTKQDHYNPKMVSVNCSDRLENMSFSMDINSQLSKSINTSNDISNISNNENSKNLFSLNASIIEHKSSNSEILENKMVDNCTTNVFEFVLPSKVDKAETTTKNDMLTGDEQEFRNDITGSTVVGDNLSSLASNKIVNKIYQNSNLQKHKSSNFHLIGGKTEHDNMMTDTQMIFAVEHAELMHQLTEDGSIFSQWSKENYSGGSTTENEIKKEVRNIDTGKYDSSVNVGNSDGNILSDTEICDKSNEIAMAMSSFIAKNNQNKGEENNILPENVQNEFSECIEDNFTWSRPDPKFEIKAKTGVKVSFGHEEDIGDILNSTVIRHLFNEGQEKDFQDTEDKPYEKQKPCFTRKLLNFDESGMSVNEIYKSNDDEKEQKVKVSVSKLLKREKENFLCNEKLSSSNDVTLLDMTASKVNNLSENEQEREPLKVKDTNDNSHFQDSMLRNGSYSNTNKNLTANSIPLKDSTHEIEIQQLKENKHLNKNKPPVMQEFQYETLENAECSFPEETSFKEPRFVDKEKKMIQLSNTHSQFETDTTVENTTIPDTSIMLSEIRSMFSDENDIETDCCGISDSEREVCMTNGSPNHVQNPLDKVLVINEQLISDKQSKCDVYGECVFKVWKNNAEFSLNESKGLEKKDLTTLSEEHGVLVYNEITENKNIFADCKKLKASNGFITARGKQISVSEEALNKAKSIFSEDGNEIDQNMALPVKTTSKKVSGLKVICKRDVTFISDESNKYKHDLHEDVIKGNSYCKQSLLEVNNEVSRFCVTSGKEVSVSEKALSSASSLFPEDLHESTCLDINENNSEFEITKFKGVQTANTNRITVSKDTYHGDTIGCELYEDIEFPLVLKEGFTSSGGRQTLVSEGASNSTHVEYLNNTNDNAFFDDSDNGKKVIPTEDAIINTRDMFSEIGFQKEKMSEGVNTCKSKFQGFLTASGKTVNVSDEALTRAKNLFLDETVDIKLPKNSVACSNISVPIESNNNENVKLPVNNLTSCDSVSGDFKIEGFSDEKALAKSQGMPCKSNTLLPESNFQQNCIPPLPNIFPDISTIQGFISPSGRKVSVSANAKTKTKTIFSENSGEATKQSVKYSFSSVSTNFPGFSTASDKNDAVSKNGLMKARGLFSEDNIETCLLNKSNAQSENKPLSTVSTKFQGFSTASGKNVAVSEDALKKARSLFSEDNIEMDLLNKTNVQSENKSLSIESTKFQGFSTASGKNVTVSDDALKKARNLFSEDIMERDLLNKTNVHSKNKSLSSESTKFQGYSTASGKNVAVSKDALKKARLLFSEDNVETYLLNKTNVQSENKSLSSVSTKFQGFSTASGKNVAVSKDALKKARHLFSEDNIRTDLLNTTNVQSENKSSSMSTKFQGFSTASGKTVGVSEDALRKSKDLFLEHNIEMDLSNKMTVQSGNKSPLSTKFQGFSTADGKNVAVSEDALKKARSLFSEDNIEIELLNKSPIQSETKSSASISSMFQGFSTAGGKYVTVSEEALNKVRDIFSEDLFKPEECAKDTSPKTMVNSTSLKYRESAKKSSSKISISKDVIHEMNTYSEEFKNEFLDYKPPAILRKRKETSLSKFNGFATASGKEVPVSASALDKARNLLIDDMDNIFVELCNVDESVLINNSIKELKSIKKLNEISLDDKCKDEAICSESKFTSSPILKSLGSAKRTNASKGRLKRGRLSLSAKKSNINLSKSPKKTQPLSDMDGPQQLTPNYKYILHNECKNKSTRDNQSSVLVGRKGAAKQNINFNVTDTSVNEEFVKPLSNIKEPTAKMSPSLTQEVKESAAALLADEDSFDSSFWGLISCPDMLNDRSSAPTALVSSEENVSQIVRNKTPGSPVLSRSDHCKRKWRNRFSQSSSPDGSMQCTQQSRTSSFTVPYRSIKGAYSSGTQPIKRLAMQLEYSTPFAKRLKVSDSRKMVGRCLENCNYNCVLGKRDICAAVAAGRQAAAAAQDAIVKSKVNAGTGPRSCKGSYYLCKQEKHLQKKWRDVVDGENPGRYTRSELISLGLNDGTLNISAENAADFRFSAWNYHSTSVCQENISGLLVGDGAQLVLDSKGTAGVEEVTRAFLSSPGVEPALVPAGWVANHYRWLVWKLAATEWSFPHQFSARCFTPNMLLLQLKYRYDREIDDCHRPAIRKILEHDDCSAKRLVLCVARIIKLDSTDGDSRYELELTDGWYGITATVDQEMSQRIHRGIIEVGTKLITHGAELVNCDQGCSPLEVGRDVRLKLCSNSTRRARWDSKLGYCTHPGPIPISLTSVLPAGGLVGCVSITVVRVYPLLYVEKFEEGKSIFRSVRAEEQAAAQWERKWQACVEEVYSQIRKEMSQEDAESAPTKSRGLPTAHDITSICSGETLAQILESAPDPESVEVLLNEEQKFAVTEYQRMKNERLQQELQSRVQEKLKETSSASRNVLPLLKVRCVDPRIPMSVKSAVLSVWRPSEEVSRLLSEGTTIKAFNLQTAGLRSGDLQLSAGRHTAYKPSPNSSPKFHRRKVTDLTDINSDFQPPFGELDVVGMVVHIGTAPQGTSGFQTVYLADSFSNVLGVAFWGGVKHFGWEEMLKPRTLVSASNLQWRHGAAIRWVPCAYASELSVFSAHPRQTHLQEGLASLSQQIERQGMDDFYSTCENKVSMFLSGAASPLPGSISAKSVGSRLNDSLHNGINSLALRTPPNPRGKMKLSRNLLSNVNSPMLSGPIEELNINCSTHIDFGDSPLDRRLYKLRQYGDAPSLSTDVYIPVLPSVCKEFHVPKKMISPAASPPLSLDSDPG